MRIAQVAPLYESVPPKLYGGTERVVAYLTEELVRSGHDVTLFASADSETSARLVPSAETALRLAGPHRLSVALHFLMLENVFARADEFDVIHFHIDTLQLPFVRRHSVSHVTTMHGRLDLPDLDSLFRTYPDAPVVSISDSQRLPLPWLNWEGTVYHGLPLDLYTARPGPKDYLLFLGRICEEKGPVEAIEIAKRSGRRLVIAAKVDPVDKVYFGEVVEPLLDHPLVDYIGEVAEAEKKELLAGALGVLFPIGWPEPFGMVMIEAFASGTPVIAFPHGSVREIMVDGVSGFVVDGVEKAIDAVGRLEGFDRPGCRRYFEQRFSVQRMAEDYARIYERLLVRPASPHADGLQADLSAGRTTPDDRRGRPRLGSRTP